jgi:predicted dehydrogenase
MADKLRFGLIGCGGQGRYLSEALAITGRAELTACADPNPEAVRKAVDLCGYRQAYPDAGEMLAQASLDAVIVATTHDQLQPAAMAALEAGVHAMVEKPMALNAAGGRALVEAAKKADRKLTVGYTLRFLPERIQLKKLLDDGAIGDVVHVLAGQCIGSMGGWLGDPERGGGPLLYIGTHVIDQVLWVANQPAERVHAEVDFTESGVDAGAHITIRFAGGVAAQVCTSQRIGGRYGWLDVIGSAGRLRAEWERPEVYVESQVVDAYRNPTLIRVPDGAHLPAPVPEARARLSGFRYVRSWAAELGEFIAAIVEDRPPAVTGEAGVRVLEITDAVLESARLGEPVNP